MNDHTVFSLEHNASVLLSPLHSSLLSSAYFILLGD